MTVDGLGADAVLRVLQFHPPGDLLGRPSHGKAVLDAGAQVGGTLDLRASQLARPGPPVGAVRTIGIDASVPHDLSVDRRTVTPKAQRDLIKLRKRHLSSRLRWLYLVPMAIPDIAGVALGLWI
jgi:hypothetical protein